jgi:hypothetical protein
MPKNLALFACVVLALAGANALEAWSVIVSFFFTDRLPQSSLFTFHFWIWLPIAVAAAWCGLSGGYAILRNGNVKAFALTVFVTMSCVALKVEGQDLGFSAIRLGLNIGIGDLSVGLNALGFLFLLWLTTLRRDAERVERARSTPPDVELRGRGAV